MQTTVIMVAGAAGPSGSLQAGQIYTLPAAVATQLIEVYAAVEVGAVHAELTRRRKAAKSQAA